MYIVYNIYIYIVYIYTQENSIAGLNKIRNQKRGLAFCFDAFSFEFLDVFLPIAKKKQMNRFRSKFLDVFSLIKTSSKNRKIRKFLPG